MEIIRAMLRDDSSADIVILNDAPMPSIGPATTRSGTGSNVMFPHESEQQEDYLWGV